MSAKDTQGNSEESEESTGVDPCERFHWYIRKLFNPRQGEVRLIPRFADKQSEWGTESRSLLP